MEQKVFSSLAAVRRRQQWQFAIRVAIYGLLLSAGAGIGLGIWKLLAAEPISAATAIGILLTGPVLGAGIGLVWRRSWQLAASAVDTHYQLKDRALTALEFVNRSTESSLHQLQVDDAATHLSQVEAARVVPYRLPRTFPYALASLAVAITLLVWPNNSGQLEASPQQPLPGILAVADEIEEELDQLDEVAQEQQDQELQALVEQLREETEAMKEPEVDVREALAKLSEMQAAIAAQQAKYNDALVDAQLQSLGAAMMTADGLKGAGKELQEGDFDEAAEKLEKMENVELQRREAKAASDRMNKVAKAMSDSGLGQLSEAVSEVADGIESGNSSKAGQTCRQLGKMVRKHSTRRKINSLLASKLNKLSECKSLCQGLGQCKQCGGNCQGGQCQGQGQGNKNSLAEGLNPKKSTSPKNTFGKSTSGNLYGEQTELASTRNVQEITGMQGDGPSSIETSNSPEGREQARRGYREVYQEYKKLSEAVLDSEPIPLGHRHMIRRYFELIRPQGAAEGSAEQDSSAGRTEVEE